MSSLDDDMLSTSVQISVINANLNSSLMFVYFMGIYIAIYAATICIYISNRQSAATVHRRMITGVLTALFALLLAQLSFQWYFTLETFSIQGDSRQNIYASGATGPAVPDILAFLPSFLENIIILMADGIMVWRCFHASARSIVHFALPMGCFFTEFALVITHAVFTVNLYFNPNFSTDEHYSQVNDITGALFLTAAATSSLATFVILWQIFTNTSRDPRSRRRYKHIIDALTQSCAVYTSLVIIETIIGFLDRGQLQESISLIILDSYTEALVVIASALVPTLMVGRLAIGSGSTDVDLSSVDIKIPSHLILHISPEGYDIFNEDRESQLHEIDASQS